MAREKKEKPPKKEKAPKVKKEKAPRGKKDKEQKEETLLQKLMRQAKIKGAEEEEPEEAAAPEEQEEEAGGHKRKLILLIAAAVLILAAVAVVVIFVILPRFSGENEPQDEPPEESSQEPVLYDLPASYEVGEETVTGVVPLLPDGVQAEKDPRVRYTYTGMTDAGAEAESYASSLRGQGFSVVDSEFVRTDAPDYTTAEGTVLLAKNMQKKAAEAGTDAGASPSPTGAGTDGDASPSPTGAGTDEGASPSPTGAGTDGDASPSPTGAGTDGDASASPAPAEEQKDMVLTVELAWAEGTMTVTCDQAEGKVTNPDRPLGTTPSATMTMWEAEEFLRGLEPSVLGLSGTSMQDYRIYAIDGAVLVNGQPCMRLNIYSREEGQSNEVAGIYLMSRDGQHLYLLDEEAKSVKEIALP